MSGKSCPKHPDSESMVPCLGCGKYFCSICDPIRGAGQYCPVCYEESLSKITLSKPRPTQGRLHRPRGRSKEKRSAGPQAGPPGSKECSTSKRFAVPGGVGAGVMRKRSAKSAGDRPEREAGGAKRMVVSFGGYLRALPGRIIPQAVTFTVEHFPLAIVDTRRGEEMPPLARSWYRLLPVVLSGAAVWTAIVVIGHKRVGWQTWIVAAVVAACVVWSLGSRFDLPTAIVTMMLTLLSLTIGELTVHLLYSSEVIKLLDLAFPGDASVFYSDFFYKVLVTRMLPSALIAFLIGLWPFPRRIGWRGFKRAESD
jgi:hypothetical protein